MADREPGASPPHPVGRASPGPILPPVARRGQNSHASDQGPLFNTPPSSHSSQTKQVGPRRALAVFKEPHRVGLCRACGMRGLVGEPLGSVRGCLGLVALGPGFAGPAPSVSGRVAAALAPAPAADCSWARASHGKLHVPGVLRRRTRRPSTSGPQRQPPSRSQRPGPRLGGGACAGGDGDAGRPGVGEAAVMRDSETPARTPLGRRLTPPGTTCGFTTYVMRLMEWTTRGTTCARPSAGLSPQAVSRRSRDGL